MSNRTEDAEAGGLRNRKLPYEYSISISVVMDAQDIEEVEAYAEALMADIRDDDSIAAADWYNIIPIRKCRPKNGTARRRVRKPTRKNV